MGWKTPLSRVSFVDKNIPCSVYFLCLFPVQALCLHSLCDVMNHMLGATDTDKKFTWDDQLNL